MNGWKSGSSPIETSLQYLPQTGENMQQDSVVVFGVWISCRLCFGPEFGFLSAYWCFLNSDMGWGWGMSPLPLPLSLALGV